MLRFCFCFVLSSSIRFPVFDSKIVAAFCYRRFGGGDDWIIFDIRKTTALAFKMFRTARFYDDTEQNLIPRSLIQFTPILPGENTSSLLFVSSVCKCDSLRAPRVAYWWVPNETSTWKYLPYLRLYTTLTFLEWQRHWFPFLTALLESLILTPKALGERANK